MRISFSASTDTLFGVSGHGFRGDASISATFSALHRLANGLRLTDRHLIAVPPNLAHDNMFIGLLRNAHPNGVLPTAHESLLPGGCVAPSDLGQDSLTELHSFLGAVLPHQARVWCFAIMTYQKPIDQHRRPLDHPFQCLPINLSSRWCPSAGPELFSLPVLET